MGLFSKLKSVATLKPLHGALFGREGEGPSYIDPELERQNLEAAQRATGLRSNIQAGQSEAVRGFGRQLADLRSLPGADTRANIQIEQQRRLFDRSNESSPLAGQLSRRGLSGTATGLRNILASKSAGQDQLNQLEYGRLGLTSGITDQDIAARGSALSGLGAVGQGAYLPQTQFMTPGREARKGLLGGILGAGGAVVGGMFGGPAGAQAGGTVGTTLGEGVTNEYQSRRFRPTNYG